MSEKANILFVDDEERIVRLLNIMFRDKYNVFIALTPHDALNIVKTNRIDVIVSDQRMPDMLGNQLLAKVREISPNTMRVLLTGYSDLVEIIGAINEGEVYRFLNKPWSQEEIRAVVAECAAIALTSEPRAGMTSQEGEAGSESASHPLASAVKLLALDGIASDRYEVMEMFTNDYHIIGASSITEALQVLQQHNVGVIIADTQVGEEDSSKLLAKLSEEYPYIPIVLVASSADSNTLIDLINHAKIYRFAMKPIGPNLFRLAVAAAMKEYHRRLADPRLAGRIGQGELPPKNPDTSKDGEAIAKSLVTSLSKFTRIW